MRDELLTLAILMVALATVLERTKYDDNCTQVLDKKWTTAIKGLCCIVVIFAHIPAEYSTKLQNAVGSFAYIAVTIFFVFSGYGLAVNRSKKGYFNHFWRNRLVSLLAPMLIVNILKEIYSLVTSNLNLRILFGIDGFVLMLSLCYVAWYLVERTSLIKEKHKAQVTCFLILLISIVTYCMQDKIPFTVWPVPCLGFAYGVLLARYIDRIKTTLAKHKIIDIHTIIIA